MKKMIRNSLLLAGVAGFFSLANQLGAAADAAPACNVGSCCGGATQPMAADAKTKPYPLDTCIVSGEKLGEMGKPFVFVYQDQEIKLCCKGCKKDFDKDPEKFLKKLADGKK